MGPADSVLNSVATTVCYCCVAFGTKEGEEVGENYKTGSFVICAAEQQYFVDEITEN